MRLFRACDFRKTAGETPALQKSRPASQFRAPNLTPVDAQHIVLRKEKVEIGNLAEHVLSASGRRMSLAVEEVRKPDE